MRVLIVDDEAPARSELRHLLGAHPDVEVTGEASTAADALALAEGAGCDAVFLDVEMAGLSGLEAAPLFEEADAPAVVFVTAHSSYAAEAFAVEAFDYLLKPVDPDRLARVLARLREREARPPRPVEKIAVVSGAGTTELLDYDQVHYVRADGDYSRVHTYDRAYLCTASLRELEELLPADRFLRVHRSHLVNLAKVAAVERAAPDRLRLAVADAQRTQLEVARRQAPRLRDRLRL